MAALPILFWWILMAIGPFETANAASLVYINGAFKKSTPIGEPIGILQYLDKSKNTTFYTYGFGGKNNGTETNAMMNTLNTANNTNIVLLDWQNEAQSILPGGIDYPRGVANAKVVASALGEALVELNKNGISLDLVKLIGLSLGAHLMGWSGEKVQQLINKNVSRIVGLDPAGLGFSGGTVGLKPSQGQVVVGLHTNCGQYGISQSVGLVDFWANCGSCVVPQHQPGCPVGIFLPLSRQSLCSHIRSVYIAVEAILNPYAFPGAFATSCDAWKSQNSSNVQINYFGRNLDPRKPGNYFFSTNTQVPYSKGVAGNTANK